MGPLRTTTVPRLLVDSAAVLRPPRLLTVLDDVVGARKAVPSVVHRRAVELRPGRKGVQTLVQATAPGAAALYRSWLERYGHVLLLRAGIQGFETNVGVYDGDRLLAELDEYCAPANLPLEFDGLRFHAPPRAARAERQRGNVLRARDIVPLRYTWLDLLDEPERYIDDVVRALRSAGCGHLVGEPPEPLPPLPPLPGTRR